MRVCYVHNKGMTDAHHNDDHTPDTILKGRSVPTKDHAMLEQALLESISEDLAHKYMVMQDDTHTDHEPQPLPLALKDEIIRHAGALLFDKRFAHNDTLGKCALLMEWEAAAFTNLDVLYANQQRMGDFIGRESKLVEVLFERLPYYRAKHETPKFVDTFDAHEALIGKELSFQEKDGMIHHSGMAIIISNMLRALADNKISLLNDSEPLPKDFLDAMRVQLIKMLDEGAFRHMHEGEMHSMEPKMIAEAVEGMVQLLQRNRDEDPGMTVEEVPDYINAHSQMFTQALSMASATPIREGLEEAFVRHYEGQVFPLHIQAQESGLRH